MHVKDNVHIHMFPFLFPPASPSLPASNLTLEVKEKLFIILGTQQPRHFPEFLGCFC